MHGKWNEGSCRNSVVHIHTIGKRMGCEHVYYSTLKTQRLRKAENRKPKAQTTRKGKPVKHLACENDKIKATGQKDSNGPPSNRQQVGDQKGNKQANIYVKRCTAFSKSQKATTMKTHTANQKIGQGAKEVSKGERKHMQTRGEQKDKKTKACKTTEERLSNQHIK